MADKKLPFIDESGIDKRVKQAWKDYQKQQKTKGKKTTKKTKRK